MTKNPTAHHSYLADDDDHEAYTSVGIDGLLAATEKLLAVNRGLAEPDDRDSLPNDRVHTVDRLMAERVKLDHGRTLRSMMGRLSRAKTLQPMGPDSFSEYSMGYIKSNPLVPALEEINLMHNLEQKRRITKMGPGGIGDPNAITVDMQSVSATQFGFIDPIAGPESVDRNTFVFTSLGWVPAPELTMEHMVACSVDECLEFHHPDKCHSYPFQGELIGVRTAHVDFLVTPDHRVWSSSIYDDEHKWSMEFASDLYGAEVLFAAGYPTPPESLEDTMACPAGKSAWYKQPYDDLVFCVTVPGGMIFTRRGDGLGHWTGNSEKAGIDVSLASGARIGSDGRIYQLLNNRRTGKNEWVSPSDMRGKTLKLPD